MYAHVKTNIKSELEKVEKTVINNNKEGRGSINWYGRDLKISKCCFTKTPEFPDNIGIWSLSCFFKDLCVGRNVGMTMN